MDVRPLGQKFFEPSAEAVAPRLLGHYLLRRLRGRWAGGEIVETEAYLCKDAACHGAAGETNRNRVMFGPPGFAYVYFIYGNHYCVNAVCAEKGVAEAVLIRAIEPSVGEAEMKQNRPVPQATNLGSGPAKLCQALQIDRSLDGVPLFADASGLVIAENISRDFFVRSRGPIVIGPRIGITKATEMPLRFLLRTSEHLSRPAPGARKQS